MNFEDERLAGVGAEDLHFLVEEYYRREPEARRRASILWCFDEIQTVPGWERFVRRLLDTEHAEIVVSGSSAALLSREIATAMRGRAWEVVVHPFSFAESLAHRGTEAPTDAAALPARRRSALEGAFRSFLAEGGFPETQGKDEAVRRRMLRDYVDVAVLRDVVERHRVTNIVALQSMVRHTLGNAASTFSVEKFHAGLRSQGIPVGRDTVHAFLAHLADCFLVRAVWLESASERRRMVNPRKIYPVDTGLIPIFDRSGKENAGHALETAVLVELERRRASVTYVKLDDGREIDFLARYDDGSEELIQVCVDATAPETAARELGPFAAARKQFPRAAARLLVLNADGLPAVTEEGVVAEPTYRWMLRGR